MQTGEQDRALDLSARHLGIEADAVQRPAVNGQRRMAVRGLDAAPMRASGSMTRRIGRRDNDASPIMVAVNGRAASSPAIIRIVVPEFPASSGPPANASREAPSQSIVTVPRPIFDRSERRGPQTAERGVAVGTRGVIGQVVTGRRQARRAARSDAQSTCRRAPEDDRERARAGEITGWTQSAPQILSTSPGLTSRNRWDGIQSRSWRSDTTRHLGLEFSSDFDMVDFVAGGQRPHEPRDRPRRRRDALGRRRRPRMRDQRHQARQPATTRRSACSWSSQRVTSATTPELLDPRSRSGRRVRSRRVGRSAGAGEPAQASGRGIFLIRSFMDDVQFRGRPKAAWKSA